MLEQINRRKGDSLILDSTEKPASRTKPALAKPKKKKVVNSLGNPTEKESSAIKGPKGEITDS